MGVTESIGDLSRDPGRLVYGELLLAAQPYSKRLPVDVRHDVIEEASGLARIEEGQDVGVVQARGDLDLLQEPLRAQRRGELGPEHLDRHPAMVPEVLGRVDRRRGSLADHALDGVSIRHGFLQLIETIHGTVHPLSVAAG